eukprot:SAG31_NODE_12788_length_917_cov_0.788509_2_plen_147_part_00
MQEVAHEVKELAGFIEDHVDQRHDVRVAGHLPRVLNLAFEPRVLRDGVCMVPLPDGAPEVEALHRDRSLGLDVVAAENALAWAIDLATHTEAGVQVDLVLADEHREGSRVGHCSAGAAAARVMMRFRLWIDPGGPRCAARWHTGTY